MEKIDKDLCPWVAYIPVGGNKQGANWISELYIMLESGEFVEKKLKRKGKKLKGEMQFYLSG